MAALWSSRFQELFYPIKLGSPYNTHIHTCTNTYTYIHVYNYTRINTYIVSYTRRQTYTQTHTNTHTQTHTYTQTNAYIFTYTHTHVHTHSHGCSCCTFDFDDVRQSPVVACCRRCLSSLLSGEVEPSVARVRCIQVLLSLSRLAKGTSTASAGLQEEGAHGTGPTERPVLGVVFVSGGPAWVVVVQLSQREKGDVHFLPGV